VGLRCPALARLDLQRRPESSFRCSLTPTPTIDDLQRTMETLLELHEAERTELLAETREQEGLPLLVGAATTSGASHAIAPSEVRPSDMRATADATG
jgi:hypothetical protein